MGLTQEWVQHEKAWAGLAGALTMSHLHIACSASGAPSPRYPHLPQPLPPLQTSEDEYLVANARAAVVSASEHLEARAFTQAMLSEKEQVGASKGEVHKGKGGGLAGGAVRAPALV